MKKSRVVGSVIVAAAAAVLLLAASSTAMNPSPDSDGGAVITAEGRGLDERGDRREIGRKRKRDQEVEEDEVDGEDGYIRQCARMDEYRLRSGKSRVCSELNVAAFNIQHLNSKKVTERGDVIARVLTRFDIVFVQEVLCDNTCMTQLLGMINAVSKPREFKFILTERLGRQQEGSWKERYAYVYDTTTVELVDFCQWPGGESYQHTNYCVDRADTEFIRPPFVARFRTAGALGANVEFGFIGVHTEYEKSRTLHEVRQLEVVYDKMTEVWKLEDFIIGGDLNTHNTWLDELHALPIYKSRSFKWVISNKVTTAVKTDNTYDRLILAGANLHRRVMRASADKYTSELKDINLSTVKAVSDHWPVWLTLRTN